MRSMTERTEIIVSKDPVTVDYPEEFLDGDGYPTDEALTYLDAFSGTAMDLVDYLRPLLENYGSVQAKPAIDFWGQPVTEVRMTTGGWSGCEEALSRLGRTLFHITFWESSHRGGLVVYRIPETTGKVAGFWGCLVPRPAGE